VCGGFLGALSLKSGWGDQALDFGGFAGGLVLVVGRQVSSDHEFGDVVFLFKVEELSDFVGSLGSKSSVDDRVGEAGDFGSTLSDNNSRDDAHVVVDEATSDTLSLPLTLSAWSVTAHALLQQKSNSTVLEHTLLHTETLFVLTTGDSQHVALELFAKAVGGHLVRDSLLEHVADFVLIVDFDGFLLASGRVGDIYFHLGWLFFFVSIFLFL